MSHYAAASLVLEISNMIAVGLLIGPKKITTKYVGASRQSSLSVVHNFRTFSMLEQKATQYTHFFYKHAIFSAEPGHAYFFTISRLRCAYFIRHYYLY